MTRAERRRQSASRKAHYAKKLVAAGLCGHCGRKRDGHGFYCPGCEAGSAAMEADGRRRIRTLTPRVPDDLAERIGDAAKREGLSLNQWMTIALAEAADRETQNGHVDT